MIVENWMTRDVITVSPEDTLDFISEIFEKAQIRRVPVVFNHKVVGIVTDRDVRSAIPSRFYLPRSGNGSDKYLKIRASQIMSKHVLTVCPTDTIERAALLMHDYKIGGLPVITDDRLIGIITEQNVFEALIELCGARLDITRLSLIIDERPGGIKEVTDIIRRHLGRIISLLMTKHKMPPGKTEVSLRIDGGQMDEIIFELEKRYGDILVHKN